MKQIELLEKQLYAIKCAVENNYKQISAFHQLQMHDEAALLLDMSNKLNRKVTRLKDCIKFYETCNRLVASDIDVKLVSRVTVRNTEITKS